MDNSSTPAPVRAFPELEIAAIVPCHNEEQSIATVVRDLKQAVPGIRVYVYDNRSTDRTVEEAHEAGAIVRHEEAKGKGNVIRRAFADIDADVYLMIDGDDTYDAFAAPELIELLLSGPYDHVLGVREPIEDDAYRAGHESGNKLINAITSWVFGHTQEDMLSGYRVMSRRFVKSFPAISREFEIETELTVHTMALRIPHTSKRVGFKDRAEGSESKLRTYSDGFKIMRLILQLARHERPFAIYGGTAALFAVLGSALITPAVMGYLRSGMVDKMPSLVMGLIFWVLSSLALVAGIVLDGIKKSRHESARLMFVRYPSVLAAMHDVFADRTRARSDELRLARRIREIVAAAPELPELPQDEGIHHGPFARRPEHRTPTRTH